MSEALTAPSELDAVEFAVNPEPRCACVLLLDTSGSMQGAAIAALNEGLRVFAADVGGDPLARERVEVAVITFGGAVQVVTEFTTASDFTPLTLTADGGTPMGHAIEVALDRLDARKTAYRTNGVPYYRPWVFLITDGRPTDDWKTAAKRVHDAEEANGLAFFAVGVEGADMDTLGQIAVRSPLKLRGLAFTELFLWLSRSQRQVSSSRPGDQTALPPVDGWAVV
ncbi:MAG: hypothetical protein QOK28_1792 [Actinomycetota bacterium]